MRWSYITFRLQKHIFSIIPHLHKFSPAKVFTVWRHELGAVAPYKVKLMYVRLKICSQLSYCPLTILCQSGSVCVSDQFVFVCFVTGLFTPPGFSTI